MAINLAPMRIDSYTTWANMRANGMKSSAPHTVNLIAMLVLVLATAALAGCGRTYSPHTYAASECWMSIEKSHPKMDLDKRYAIVSKCIDDKMKATR
jgi:hypothetical protein